MNNRITFVLIAAICAMSLFAGIASADGGNANIDIGDGKGYVTIPVTITDAVDVGSVDLTVYFDHAVVTVTGVNNGDMDSMFANLENVDEGYVRIGAYQTNNPGLDGEFVLVNVVFAPVSDYESCELGITVATFKDATPEGNSLGYTISNGTYTADRNGGGDGTYPPDGNGDGDNGNVTPTVTPTTTPTTSPTASPTKTIPDGDNSGMSSDMFWVYLVIGVISIIVLLYIMLRNRDK